MKFIDLYKKASKTDAFKHLDRKFKIWTYLAKKNPGKYKVYFDNGSFTVIEKFLVYSECGMGTTEKIVYSSKKEWANCQTMEDFK